MKAQDEVMRWESNMEVQDGYSRGSSEIGIIFKMELPNGYSRHILFPIWISFIVHFIKVDE